MNSNCRCPSSWHVGPNRWASFQMRVADVGTSNRLPIQKTICAREFGTMLAKIIWRRRLLQKMPASTPLAVNPTTNTTVRQNVQRQCGVGVGQRGLLKQAAQLSGAAPSAFPLSFPFPPPFNLGLGGGTAAAFPFKLSFFRNST